MVLMFMSSGRLTSMRERVNAWPLQSSNLKQQLRLWCETGAIGYIASSLHGKQDLDATP